MLPSTGLVLHGMPSEHVGDGLTLCPIIVNEDYCKKWNENLKDFLCLVKDGKLVRETLYRVGGLGSRKIEGKKYFILLKHVEAHYSDDITKDKKRKPHLESRWTILDNTGTERYEHTGCLTYPYLLDGGPMYSIGQKYYHIETGEYYGEASGSLTSDEFLFLNNPYAKDPSKRGVMKIHKQSGKWELFPITGSTGWKE